MSLNEVKQNESLSEILEMNLHLSEKEKKIKMEIEKLLETNKSLTEELKKSEAQSDAFCYDHFAKIENTIDLQREELKKKIDELSFDLIDQVKQCKSKFDSDLKSNSSKNVLNINEISEIESDFDENLRQIIFPRFELETLINELISNREFLSEKLDQIKVISGKIKACTFLVKEIDLNASVFGVLKFF